MQPGAAGWRPPPGGPGGAGPAAAPAAEAFAFLERWGPLLRALAPAALAAALALPQDLAAALPPPARHGD